ncbi:hypothetical protein SDC9_204348 [bioreactor metagenome]|uniref:Uncharacterized protein n=1 Tax=bioreactor metagenome TaxID=1076179 RepID=A0A645IZ09_9ZZZZ
MAFLAHIKHDFPNVGFYNIQRYADGFRPCLNSPKVLIGYAEIQHDAHDFIGGFGKHLVEL